MNTNMYTYTFTYTYTYTYKCKYMYVFICVYVCVFVFLLRGAVSCRVPRFVGWLVGWLWCVEMSLSLVLPASNDECIATGKSGAFND